MASKEASRTVEEDLVFRARELQHNRLARLLEELELEAGPIDREVMEKVCRAWPDAHDDIAGSRGA